MRRVLRSIGVLGGCLPLVLALPSCALVADLLCPAPPDVPDMSFVTPEATFHSFQRAVQANNERLEYRCLSEFLKEREEIDLQRYVLGRRHFFRKNREEVEAFKKATLLRVDYDRIYEFSPEGHEIARVILTSGDLTGEFLLINTPYWEIEVAREGEEPDAYDDFLDADLASSVRVEGRVLRVDVPLDDVGELDPASIAGVEMKNEWKVLDFLGMREAGFDREGENSAAAPRP